MRKSGLLLIFLCIVTNAYPQILRGKVVDGITGTPVQSATIYFNGTSTGTLSGEDGVFYINISRFANQPLIISALGYYSLTIEHISAEQTYLIRLQPKIYELGEVIVSAGSGSYKMRLGMYLKTFRKEFLGQTMNAARCRIINESDIFFSYDDEVLKAFSYKPLKINNPALGYEITYFLDKFEFDMATNAMTFLGNYIFRETETSGADSIKVEKRRRSAYLGSRMHLFRALWQNKLDSAGFTISSEEYINVSYDTLVVESFSDSTGVRKFLKTKGDLLVSYYSRKPTTKIAVFNEKVFFDKTGYFDPFGLSWNGDMSKQRIADMLPFEYELQPGK